MTPFDVNLVALMLSANYINNVELEIKQVDRLGDLAVSVARLGIFFCLIGLLLIASGSEK